MRHEPGHDGQRTEEPHVSINVPFQFLLDSQAQWEQLKESSMWLLFINHENPPLCSWTDLSIGSEDGTNETASDEH